MRFKRPVKSGILNMVHLGGEWHFNLFISYSGIEIIIKKTVVLYNYYKYSRARYIEMKIKQSVKV